MITICDTWSKSDIKWTDNSTKWLECRIFDCVKWNDAKVFWKNSTWAWAQCSGSYVPPEPPIPPEPVISIGNLPGVDAITLIQPWQQPYIEEQWNPYKNSTSTKKTIKLICKVKNNEYVEEKTNTNYKISVDNIQVYTKSLPIDLNLKLEE